MLRKISIGWLSQRSGAYALKGIRISEADRSYDSSSTFREEDAKWLTNILGAEADVELSGNSRSERNTDGYPEWALNSRRETSSDAVPSLDLERAGATVLRHTLSRLVEACQSKNGDNGFRFVIDEANAALAATDAGTFYTVDEARTVLGKRSQGAGKTKSKA
jgi:hypothetical protein